MSFQYRVKLAKSLRDVVDKLGQNDKELFKGLLDAISFIGIDAVYGDYKIDGVVPEFAEPGETPDMVWVRFFLETEGNLPPLRVTRSGGDIFLDGA